MITLVWWVLDGLLIAATVALAFFSLSSKNLHRAVIFFIAFGLMLSLIWLRLHAPDVALAEAAIGAGLTGALLLSAVNSSNQNSEIETRSFPHKLINTFSFLALFITMGIAIAIAWLQSISNNAQTQVAQQIFQQLGQTGVSNPVTGVLLDFRAYDTMLELAVLLAAGFGVMALSPSKQTFQPASLMLNGLSRVIVPLLVVISGYLLWVGAHAPGGAFQAAALLAAAGVVMKLAGYRFIGLPHGIGLRILMISGVGAFLFIALGVMLAGQVFFDYPNAWAGQLILLIESFATLSVAVTLVIAYLSGEPEHWLQNNNFHFNKTNFNTTPNQKEVTHVS